MAFVRRKRSEKGRWDNHTITLGMLEMLLLWGSSMWAGAVLSKCEPTQEACLQPHPSCQRLPASEALQCRQLPDLVTLWPPPHPMEVSASKWGELSSSKTKPHSRFLLPERWHLLFFETDVWSRLIAPCTSHPTASLAPSLWMELAWVALRHLNGVSFQLIVPGRNTVIHL